MFIIRHNEQWVKEGPVLESTDRLRLGDGIFDTMLCIIEEGTPPRLIHAKAHFERLLHDSQLLEITPVPSHEELEDIAIQLIKENALTAGRYAINTLITRGPAERGLMPPETMTPTLIMRVSQVPKTFPEINAITARRSFRNEGSPLSQVKSCNYGDNILALIEARNKGANESIMLNNKGKIACTTSGNIFVILNGTFYTPPLSDGVMNGITRKVFIKQFKAIECSLDIRDLQNAKGIYITNSIRGCIPLSTLNGKSLDAPSIDIKQDFYLS